jgi:hypothetical protein
MVKPIAANRQQPTASLIGGQFFVNHQLFERNGQRRSGGLRQRVFPKSVLSSGGHVRIGHLDLPRGRALGAVSWSPHRRYQSRQARHVSAARRSACGHAERGGATSEPRLLRIRTISTKYEIRPSCSEMDFAVNLLPLEQPVTRCSTR